MDLEEINKHLTKVMNDQNNRPLANFEGYSPFEIHHLSYKPFESYSPVQLQKMADSDYQMIPLFNLVKYLLEVIAKAGEIKLTDRGFLPVKIVADLYQQGYIKDFYIEEKMIKLYKETDSASIHISHILVKISGLTKKRKGKISLTKATEKLLSDNEKLLKIILEAFATKFNWAYFDGYGDNNVGQYGFGFSLILLSKYGKEKRFDSFYAEKYLKAFPALLNGVDPMFHPAERQASRCYSIRTFDRFLEYFGLVKIDRQGSFVDVVKRISTTDVFHKLIKCVPHKNYS